MSNMEKSHRLEAWSLLGSYLVGRCPSFISIAVIKYSDQKKKQNKTKKPYGENGFILQSTIVGKPRCQELELAGHISSIEKSIDK